MLNLWKIDTVKKGKLMKTLTFLALALVSFSSFSNPLIFPFNCSLFHRYDNFYLSAASTMDPKLELPSAQYNDEFCWEMGKRHANESLTQAEEDWRLDDCTLYVTKEPCLMCSGAIVNSRIKMVVFGVYDKNYGCASSLYQLCSSPKFPHRATVMGGVMQNECRQIIQEFFHIQRVKKEGKN